MDRILNTRIEKQSIYDIYRACRLCGAGAGYKMPIIQNVIDLDDQEVQLKQKIRECVQIEVHQDDKMPPLICELCVDKVNDFYEFLDMCRQTNIRTRLRLGLPPQSLPRGAPDAGDCILGLTEPVYINSDEDEPLVKQKRPTSHKNKVKKEPELRIKIEKCPPRVESRTTRLKTRREPTPTRVTRLSKSTRDNDDTVLSRLQDNSSTKSSNSSPKSTTLTTKSSKSTKASPKSILKKEEKSKSEDSSLLTPRLKRPRDSKDNKSDIPNKKVKIAIQPSSSPRGRATPASPAPAPPAPSPSSSASYTCAICHMFVTNKAGLSRHLKSHTVGFTNPKLSCNACGAWFATGDEAATHHRKHRSGRPYTCRRCTADFKHQLAYDEHFGKKQCIPVEEVPDVRCGSCWQQFATSPLLRAHRCGGHDARPGGKCTKCNRSYALLKNLRRHESSCTARRKGELVVDPELLGRLKPIQVRVARCDPLLANIKQEHYDVSAVSNNFGLDRSCIYPYISSVSSLRIKSEPEEYDHMVTIKQEIKEEFCTEEDFVHWDSASDSESDPEVTSVVLNPFAKRKRIDTLSTLSLKTIFSQRFLGKVPKKRRRVKVEHGFDSLLGNDADDSVRRDIDNIIDNLGNDNDSMDAFNDSSKDVSKLGKGFDNDLTDCSNDSAVGNDLLKDVSNDVSKVTNATNSNVLSTDYNDSSKVSNDEMDVSNDVTRAENNDTTNEITVSKDDSILPKDDSNDLSEDVNNDSVNVSNDLSKVSDDTKEVDQLKDENVKTDYKDILDSDVSRNDSPTVLQDVSRNDSPTVLQSSFFDSVQDVLIDMPDDSNRNDVLNEKSDELNDKNDDILNDNGVVRVDNDLNGGNDSENCGTVNDNENAAVNEDTHDANGVKDNDVAAELIENSYVKNGSLHDVTDVSNDKDDVSNDNVLNDNNVNNNSKTHNTEQTIVSIDKISLDREHKSNDINDKTDVFNDIISPVLDENNDTSLHVNNESHNENDFERNDMNNVFNDNTLSQCDSIENDTATYNDSKPLNSNLNTALAYESNDNTSAVDESLNDNDLRNETKSTEDEDRRLMEELDAQIAENSGNNDCNDKREVINDKGEVSNDKCEVRNDKITLEDLMAGKDDENSLGLDSISDDDFNFDN